MVLLPRAIRGTIMNDELHTVRSSVRLARRALERQLALARTGAPVEPAALGEAMAHLDDPLKELEALEKAGALRVPPGKRR